MNEPLSTTNLVKHYFNICNTALSMHQDRLVYATAIALVNKLVGGDNITLRVIDEKGELLGRYTTYFKEGQFGPVKKGELEPDARFTLKRDFLEEVVEQADEYIEHPEKLDWGWLKGGWGTP